MKSHVRHYRGREASVTFDTERCTHAEICVKGLPAVFDTSRRPWVLPDAADPKQLERVVLGCPTGALRMAPPTEERVAPGGDAAATILPEEPRGKSSASVQPDGPFHVRGRLRIHETAEQEPLAETRAALCRCGASGNKPFCDESHRRVGFKDAAAIAPRPATPTGDETSPVRFTPRPNGPLLFDGPLTISGRGARTTLGGGALCRCGHSKEKPFCDGAHREVGFEAP